MHRCDVLLLIHGDSLGGDEYIPSKLYEYLLTNRPVLGIMLAGSEAAALMQTEGHLAVGKGDIAGVTAALTDFYTAWQAGGIPAVDQRHRYTVDKAVDQLVNIAADMIQTGRRTDRR